MIIDKSKVIARVNQWLLTHQVGKMILVALAPLIVTPNLFEHEPGKSKPLYARFGYMAVLTSTSFLAWSMSKSAVFLTKRITPTIDGITGADYASFLGEIELYSGIGTWIAAFIIISLYSGWAWSVHHFSSWIVKKMNISVAPRPIAYFALTASSAAFFFGAFGVVATYTMLVIDPNDLERIIHHLDVNPLQFLMCIGILVLVRRRRETVKRITSYQLYPNWWLRILVPILTLFTPLVAPLFIIELAIKLAS